MHIKIYEAECFKNKEKAILGYPGIRDIARRINDYYSDSFLPDKRNSNMAKDIIDYYDDYIAELTYHLQNICKFFPNDKNRLLDELIRVTKRESDNKMAKNTFEILIKKFPEQFAVKKSTDYSAFIGKFKVDDHVHHKKFGNGVVISVSDPVIEVAFEKVGIKKIMVDYLELL